MIRARLRIRLPEGLWVRSVSERFPDATFRLLAGYRHGDRAVELGEITTDSPAEALASVREHPAIRRFDLLESEDRRVLGKYESTDTALYDFVERSALPVEFPIVASDGWFTFDLTGTREELDRLQSALDASETGFELESLVQTADREALLTERQRELLALAVREGYYEVPRECTLAAVAEAAGVDKATASTVLRRGEATVLKWFLAGPATKGRRLT